MAFTLTRRALALAVPAVLAGRSARAATPGVLEVGTASSFTSLDPNFQNLGPNNLLADHLFSRLVGLDPAYRPVPDLALAWHPVGEREWEFKLRPGVTWSDGTPFGPDDVRFTFERIPRILNSPSSFAQAVKPVKEIVATDPLTLRLVTWQPEPLLPLYLGQVRIVSRRHGEGAGTADYNSGKAAIGTGPFVLDSVALGSKVVLRRNDRFYGEASPWSVVNWRVIANNGARTAALQAGDVDIVDGVSTHDVAALTRDPKLAVTATPGQRLMYIVLDTGREPTPFVFDNAGKPLDRNPLKDLRVRRALSRAINRPGLKTQIMDGYAAPTGQLMPEGAAGYDPAIPVDTYDPAGARKLLTEAGYPDGFRLTLQGPNDRYVNDKATLEAVGQMWSRVGVKTTVDAKPVAMLAGETARDANTAYLNGWASDTGEASSSLIKVAASSNPEKGRGATFQASHFADAAVDAAIERSLATFEDEARAALYRKATAMAMEAQCCIPLFHQVNIAGSRKGLQLRPRQQEGIRAWEVDEKAAG